MSDNLSFLKKNAIKVNKAIPYGFFFYERYGSRYYMVTYHDVRYIVMMQKRIARRLLNIDRCCLETQRTAEWACVNLTSERKNE
jgi:hypothetical protein